MRALLAIISCHAEAYREKVQAQRETWIPEVTGMDVRVFLGKGEPLHPDEICLDCDDSYMGLPEKVRLMFKWALDNGYDGVWRIDDDVYVQPGRMLRALPWGLDYVGRMRGPSGQWKAPYCSGFCYWLSRKAMEVRVNGVQPNDYVEDRTTGTMMMEAGIRCDPDYRYVVATSNKNGTSGDEGPRRGNNIIASCEYSAISMRQVHAEWGDLESMGTRKMIPAGTPFDEVCVLIKTFLRDGMLKRCVDSIEKYMSGARVVIVDDGKESREKIKWYSELREKGHSCVWLEFDAGFGAKSNAAIRYYDRPFTLIGSDDFQWNEESAEGVLKMLKVLRHNPSIGVAAGRVDGQKYEANIVSKKRADGLLHVTLVPPPYEKAEAVDGVKYLLCDHTVNYNLVRREVFSHVKWNEKWKIGGDHLLFYDQVRAAGYKVAWVEGVNIHQMKRMPGDALPQYDEARSRARLALPDLFRSCGWYAFTSLDGRTDTLESVERWAKQYLQAHPPGVIGPRIDMKEIRRIKREQHVALRRERQARAGLLPAKGIPRKDGKPPLR